MLNSLPSPLGDAAIAAPSPRRGTTV
jgi:hypothetical protein